MVEAHTFIEIEDLDEEIRVMPEIASVVLSFPARNIEAGVPHQALVAFDVRDKDGNSLTPSGGIRGSALVSISSKFGPYSYLDTTEDETLTITELLLPPGAVSVRITGHDWRGKRSVKLLERPTCRFIEGRRDIVGDPGKRDPSGWLARMQDRLQNSETFVPSNFVTKQEIPKFASLIGVAVPERYYIGSYQDLLDHDLPEELVIKPAFASGGAGVHLLQRLSASRWLSLKSGTVLTREMLVESCDSAIERFGTNGSSNDFIAEELLFTPEGRTPPPDVRVFCFQGTVGMVSIVDRSAALQDCMYFDGDFQPFADVDCRYQVTEKGRASRRIVEAVPPRKWKELKAVAERVSTAVPSAFCRVDLYETNKGIVLGEVTLHPGTFQYGYNLMSPSESSRLGRLWGEAEERLIGSSQGSQAIWPA